MKSRYLLTAIQFDALKDRQMAFISGPRQVGKTSLALQLITSQKNYFNWDEPTVKRSWVKDPLSLLKKIEAGPVVFDEIHKYRLWKGSLKGLYDRVGKEIPIIVTGSARLDLYKKGGDSLLGRYLPYRLHPFTVSEHGKQSPDPDHLTAQEIRFPLKDLEQYSGFPAPLLGASRQKALRWSRLRTEQLVREDIRDLKNVHDLDRIRLLIELLPLRVGSPLSIHSLKEDLQVAYATVREWVTVLKHLYVCFQVPPYSKNIARSLTKESKYYLYDWLSIEDAGARLENIVAVHLQKACHYWTDTAQGFFELCYIRTKDKLEVDFCILRDKKPWMLVECKSGETNLAPSFKKIQDQLGGKIPAYQLTTQNIDRKILLTSCRIMNVEKFLSMFV